MILLDVPRGLLAILGLLVLPGAWLTFSPLGGGLVFWPRLWLAVALSPSVVLVQFYVLRLLGVPFGATAWLIALGNLGAGWLVARHARGAEGVPRDARLETAAVGGVCLLILALYYHNRLITGHVWMHADIEYQLAAGMLRPEEAALAGVRLGYPWFGHVQQVVYSWVTDDAPISSYVWLNAVWLVGTLGLTWNTMTALGAGTRGKAWSLILLLFGVNFVGYLLWEGMPTGFFQDFPVTGDGRYTPWLRKFLRLNQQSSAEMVFSGLLLLAVNRSRETSAVAKWLLTTILLCSLGILYPILAPAACGLVGATVVSTFLVARGAPAAATVRWLLLAGASLAAFGIATYVGVRWVTQDRVLATGVAISTLFRFKIKAVTALVVLSPLLPGATWALWRSPRLRLNRLDGPLILALTGAWCALLSAAVAMVATNEYKFIFPAASALAPLAALSMGSWLERLGRSAVPVTLAGLAIFATPAIRVAFRDRNQGPTHRIALDVSGFASRLAASERLADATNAVRRDTPWNTIVVTNDTSMHVSTVTQRSLYVPYANVTLQGVNLREDWLLSEVKGYSRDVVTERRRVVRSLFEPTAAAERTPALARLLEMDRPIAFIVDDARAAGLSGFLDSATDARRLNTGHGLSVWLVLPPTR